MPDPNETNRERLLRLIDGGPEVVKEVQEERKPSASDIKPSVVTPVTKVPPAKSEDVLESAKKFLARIRWDAATVVKITVVLVLLILALRSASDLVRSFGKPEKNPVAVVTAAPGVSDESGAGLRLVGVDWGEPPVALLEDRMTGKTYFARKNDKIKEARVKEIFKEKVTVVVRGKTLELR
jgi:hypothetical protein